MNNVAEWKKTLWNKQPYLDNYVPPQSFLSSLKRNSNFTPFTYWPLVFLSSAVTQHLAITFIFLVIFVRLKEESLDPRILVWISISCFVLGFTSWDFLGNATDADRLSRQAIRVKALKSSILIFLALMSLSPVLRTLTAATSSDSIWALSASLFSLHGLLADYSWPTPDGKVRERLTSVLSINAAISSSVVLASRLPDDLAVFALMLFSIQVFALFPMLRSRLQMMPMILQTSFTLLLSIFAIALSASLSESASFLSSAVLLIVTFIAPAVLVWAQKYKNEIRGPWDVAVPKVN